MYSAAYQMLPRRARAFAVCVGCTAASLIFALSGVTSLHMPRYFPLLRRWGLSGPRGELSMDYYGSSLLAVGAAALLSIAAYAIAIRLPRWHGVGTGKGRFGRFLLLWLAYAGSALLWGTGLFGYKLLTREPVPMPLPSWYQPR